MRAGEAIDVDGEPQPALPAFFAVAVGGRFYRMVVSPRATGGPVAVGDFDLHIPELGARTWYSGSLDRARYWGQRLVEERTGKLARAGERIAYGVTA